MKFTETTLKGLYLIDTKKLADERGFFARVWCTNEFHEHGLIPKIVQASISSNKKKGILRGMHFQVSPSKEAKIIRCIRGAIFDVLVDIRPDSPTFKQSKGFDLSQKNARALYVPPGFAHGFVAMQDDSELLYLMTDFYQPELARGFRWNDPQFKIDWPLENPIVIERDASYKDFDEELVKDFRGPITKRGKT